MEILFELLFQLVFEVLIEGLFEFGFRGAARALRAAVVQSILAAAIGLGFGLWWGARLTDDRLASRPRLLWLSLALAVAALLVAVLRSRWTERRPTSSLHGLVDPRCWPRHRFVSMGLLNLGIAVGIEIGFTPPASPG